MTQFNFKAIGTSWRIDIYDKLDAVQEKEIQSRVMERIEAFDKAYSRFRADSLVTEMSKKAGIYELPADAEPMMSLYRDLYDRTNGLVTPLVGDLISDAGYDANYSLVQKKELIAPPAWDTAIEYAHPTLTVKKPVLLDFGAAGKGYLVDLVGELLESNYIKEYGIDAGGDILHRGKNPIRIGLEDPERADEIIGVCTLINGSICGSAGNRRKWADFTHIMNPKTLSSPADILAVWVTANSAMVADGLATCLFFAPPSALQTSIPQTNALQTNTAKNAYTFEYVIVYADRSIDMSPGFPGELFTREAK